MNTQAAFRGVNDSIRELAPGGLETDTFEFFCECPDIECHATVSLKLLEFDEHRAASPPTPILAEHDRDQPRPKLVFFYSPRSGRCRRVEGFVAQVLQRRRNHETFELVRVSVDERPDLAERFGAETVPTLCVVEGRRLQKRIAAPRGCRELERELAPWLS
jgi:hypothetical protein